MTNRTRAEYVKDLYNIDLPEIVHNYPFYTKDDSIENKYDIYGMLDIPRDKPILLYQGGIQVGRGLDKIVEAQWWNNCFYRRWKVKARNNENGRWKKFKWQSKIFK